MEKEKKHFPMEIYIKDSIGMVNLMAKGNILGKIIYFIRDNLLKVIGMVKE